MKLIVPVGCLLALMIAVLAWISGSFAPIVPTLEKPVLGVTLLMVAMGFLLFLPWLHRDRLVSVTPILFFALLFRVLLLFSSPILETDPHRYLWEGFLISHGESPYEKPPQHYLDSGGSFENLDIDARAAETLALVNHPDLTSIYPPLNQVFFSLAHFIKPFSLPSLKIIWFLIDILVIFLVLKVLRRLGRPDWWVLFYAWNPLALKEIYNSGHMDILILPFLIGALLSNERRPLVSCFLLGMAAAVKFWPLILLPLMLRNAIGPSVRYGMILKGLLLAGIPFFLSLYPFLASDPSESGLLKFTKGWEMNDFFYTYVFLLFKWVFSFSSVDPDVPARIFLILVYLGLFFLILKTRVENFKDLGRRALYMILVFFVLSPSPYPWYAVWFLPLVYFDFRASYLLLLALLPLYYSYFWFRARDQSDIFHFFVVALEFLAPLYLWYRERSKPDTS